MKFWDTFFFPTSYFFFALKTVKSTSLIPRLVACIRIYVASKPFLNWDLNFLVINVIFHFTPDFSYSLSVWCCGPPTTFDTWSLHIVFDILVTAQLLYGAIVYISIFPTFFFHECTYQLQSDRKLFTSRVHIDSEWIADRRPWLETFQINPIPGLLFLSWNWLKVSCGVTSALQYNQVWNE